MVQAPGLNAFLGTRKTNVVITICFSPHPLLLHKEPLAARGGSVDTYYNSMLYYYYPYYIPIVIWSFLLMQSERLKSPVCACCLLPVRVVVVYRQMHALRARGRRGGAINRAINR